MPRRTKLTPVVFKSIVEAVEKGASLPIAFKSAGIGERTGYEWYERGRGLDPDRPSTRLYAQFAQEIEAAEGRAGIRAVSTIEAAIRDGDVRAAQWWLERRDPHNFGRPQLEPKAPININDSNVAILTIEDAVRLIREQQHEWRQLGAPSGASVHTGTAMGIPA